MILVAKSRQAPGIALIADCDGMLEGVSPVKVTIL